MSYKRDLQLTLTCEIRFDTSRRFQRRIRVPHLCDKRETGCREVIGSPARFLVSLYNFDEGTIGCLDASVHGEFITAEVDRRYLVVNDLCIETDKPPGNWVLFASAPSSRGDGGGC